MAMLSVSLWLWLAKFILFGHLYVQLLFLWHLCLVVSLASIFLYLGLCMEEFLCLGLYSAGFLCMGFFMVRASVFWPHYDQCFCVCSSVSRLPIFETMTV